VKPLQHPTWAPKYHQAEAVTHIKKDVTNDLSLLLRTGGQAKQFGDPRAVDEACLPRHGYGCRSLHELVSRIYNCECKQCGINKQVSGEERHLKTGGKKSEVKSFMCILHA
jgi:hypothetical protein